MKINYSLILSLLLAAVLPFGVNAQKPERTSLSSTLASANYNPSVGRMKCTNLSSGSSVWKANNADMPGNLKAFQENDGQFLNLVNDWKISYGANCQGVQVLFTPQGVLYYVPESVKMTPEEIEQRERNSKDLKKQDEESEKEKESKYKTIYHNIAIQWENSNPNPTIEAVGETPFYFGSINPITPTGINNIKGFKKLIYHDVYPGIDIEYSFTEGKGFKYAVKVKAGANASLFKMHYSGQDGLSVDADGNLRIKTAMGDVIDHAPITKQGGRTVTSSFAKLDKNNIVFKLGTFDKTSDVTIDPWVTFPITATYIPTDLGMDAANNVYVLEWSGGFFSGTMYMQKFAAGTGVLVWTYAMVQYGAQYSISDMTIDPAGNTYTPQPYYFSNISGGSYSMLCLNAAGSLVYFYDTYAPLNVFETWNTAYSCQYDKLIEAGSPQVTQEQVGIVNAANGNFNGPLFILASISELYTGTIAPNGNLYCISSNHCFCTTGTSSFTNNLCAYNIAGVTAVPLWNVPIPKYNYADFSTKNPGGIPNNGIAVSCNNIYTTDGVNLYEENINTGAVINSAIIPGGVNTSSQCNSGIAVDPICGYVYVGDQSNVQVYTSTLTPVTTYATPGIVYDVTYDNGLVAACGATTTGQGFVAQFAAQTCPVPITMTHTNTTCGANNGTATATPTFCTGPYTYLWTPSGETTQTATGLSAGTYTVSVGTTISCITNITDTVTIFPSPPSFTITKNTTASLCTGNTGTASITVAGGVAPYTYSWSNGATTSNTTGLSSGVYCVTVTDHAGCKDTVCVNVPNAGGLTVTINPVTNVTCFNGTNGGADGVPAGGTLPYTYTWSNGETVVNATGLSAGSYTLILTDANGCTDNAVVTITEPTQLRDSIVSFKNPLCAGSSNGKATVGAKGGTGNYTYSWTTVPVQTSANATGLSAGTYTITVTDANGCTGTASVTLVSPAPVTVTTTTTPSSCLGNTGSATATPSGGTGGTYTYKWTLTGGTNAIAPGLSSGSYTITVTDSNGCTGSATALVGNVGGEGDTIVDIHNVKCYNVPTGSAVDSAIGGTPPYTYAWSNGQTTSTATGLSAGTYTVTTKDNKGCISVSVVKITQPTQLRDSITNVTDITCFGLNNGSATVGVKGGTLAYTYVWAPAGGTAATGSGLSGGTFTVTVTDANGCKVTASATITEPPVLKLTAAAFPTTCNGGSDGQATVIPSGGTLPYTYAWTSGSTSANANNLTAGTYTITVTDAHGCTHDTTLVVKQPPPIVVAFAADTLSGCYPLCFNFVDGSTDNPNDTIDKWAWNFGDGGKDTLENPRHCYTGPGVFSVTLTVTDNKGCTGTLTTKNMITVWDHPHPSFTFTPQPTTIYQPTITFTDQSTDSYGIVSWLWNFGDPFSDSSSTVRNPVHKYGDTGTFCPTLTVTNLHGCVDSITECLVILPQYTLYIPDAFTPNGDGKNDVFMPKGEYVYNYNMYVFDRWGLLIFHSTDLYKGWDGSLGGNICQEDTYVYLITCTDNLNQKHSYIGKVTLIK